MRSIQLRVWLMSLALVGLVCGLTRAHAQAPTLLINYNHSWKYYTNGNSSFGNAWRTTGYDDSAWRSGGGVFGYPPGETIPAQAVGAYMNTIVHLTNSAGTQLRTYYFRTTFTFSQPTNEIILTLSNVLDDAAAFWLNGSYLTRQQMPNQDPATYNYDTQSSSADDTSWYTWTVMPTNLIQGDNVLAVELHQGGGSSSDLLFGLNLTARRAQPPTITTHPLPFIRAEIGTATNMSVVASGDPTLTYQWYVLTATATNPVPGGTTATYNFTVHPTNSFIYWCVVQNPYGSVTSALCRVQAFVHPLAITQQPPASQTVVEGEGATIPCLVSGSLPEFQWQKTNSSAAGGWTNVPYVYNNSARSNILTITEIVGVKPSDAGLYRLVITNWSSSLTSAVSQLIVRIDTFGPVIVSAIAEDFGNGIATNINLKFHERVLSFPYDFQPLQLTNYVIQETNSGLFINVTNVKITPRFAQEYILQVDQMQVGTNYHYKLTVNNIHDLKGNVIAPDSAIGVAVKRYTRIFPMTSQWRTFYGDDFFYSSDIESYWGYTNETAWRTNMLEPPVPYYGEGNAVLYIEQDYGFTNLCEGSKGYTLSWAGIVFYFARQFTMPPVSPEARLELHTVLDDGAVYYLNGVEIGRDNMPEGRIYYNTLAASGVGTASCATNYFSVSNLVAGTNILAAEVHQISQFSSDIAFGAELWATLTRKFVLPEPQGPIVLDYRRQGSLLTLSWEPGGYALQYTDNPSDPYSWAEVQPDMKNPYRKPISEAKRFYRLARKQF